MSRSDGQFPPYQKIDIDVDVWPDKFWEKTRICSECGFHWPHTHIFDPSVCCNATTVLTDGSPHLRWPDAVNELLKARFDILYDEYNEGMTDEQLGWDEVTTDGRFDEEKAGAAIESLIDDATSVPSPGGK